MSLEIVLRVTIWLLDAARVKLVHVIQSLDALRIYHIGIRVVVPENAAHRDLLLAISVFTVASTETPCRYRRSLFETIGTANLGTFLSVEGSHRSLDDICGVVRG